MGLRNALRSVRKIVSKKAAVVAAVVVLGIAGAVSNVAKPVEAGNCNPNSVIYCGAFSPAALQSSYGGSSSVRAIYGAAPFGISSGEFYGAMNSLQTGAVYKNGNVALNGRIVATGALTAGRSYIAGGSHRMNIPGVEAYYRQPSVSFRQNSISAFVKLDANGRFQFAILKDCGNPVVANPTTPPPPPKPKPVPSFTLEKKVRLADTNNEWKEDITIKPGQRVEYVIAVRNTSTENLTLTNMNVRDKLPNSMTYVKNSTHMVTSYSGKKNLPDGVTGNGINIGNMPAGGTAFVTFKADAPKASNTNLKFCDTGNSVLHNIAYAHPTGLPEKNNGADVETCRTPKPNYEIAKVVKIAGTNDQYTEDVTADPGTALQFAIAVKNTSESNVKLKNVVVKDILPQNMTYKAGSATIVSSTDGKSRKLSDDLVTTKGVTIASMQKGEVVFIIFQATLPNAENPVVKECEVGKVKLTNKVTVTPAGLPTKTDTASGETCKKTPGFEIVKNIRKSGTTAWGQDTTVTYGDSVDYQILVQNTGKTDLTNVLVKDNRPTGVDYVAGSLKVNGAASNGDLFGAGVTIPVIKQGTFAEVTFSAKVNGQPEVCATKTFKNIASALPTGLTVKSDDANVTAECKPANPKVEITKLVDGVKTKEVELNQEFTYQLLVKNTGDVALKNAVVTDPAPAGVQMISADKGTITNNALSYTIPSLPVNGTVAINIKAKVTSYDPAAITNTACVDAIEIPGDKDDCDTAETTTKKPKIKIVKTVSQPVVAVDGTFSYTLQVTNTGQKILKNAKVTDPAPEGVAFLSSDQPVGTTRTVTATNFEATIAQLNPGQKVTFTLQAKVTKQVVGAINNTACVDAVEIPGDKDDCSTVEIHTPSYECNSLAALSLGDFKYRFTPQVAVDKATVKSVSYDFGDSSAPVVVTSVDGVEHTFPAPVKDKVGYTITATVTFNVNDVVKTATCKANVDLNPNVEEVCEFNPSLPKDSPDCVKDVCPSVPGMQTNPKDCETPKQPPVTVIPSTGAGDMIGGAAGISATTYGVAAFLGKRRALKNLK
jgi:uncharacterized repeat protein (TIGR01451 family)